MRSQLYILSCDESVAQDQAFCKLSQFFGLKPELVALRPGQQEPPESIRESHAKDCALAVSCATVLRFFDQAWFSSLLDDARFILVYGFAATGGARPELTRLTRGAIGSTTPLPQGSKLVRIHSDVSYNNFPVSGGSYTEAYSSSAVFECDSQRQPIETYISVNDRPYFVGIRRQEGMLFLLAEESFVDIDTILAPKASLRSFYAQLIAGAIFLRTSLGEQCWTAPVTPANFIVDDPHLKRRYGFIRYEALIGELQRTRSALTIAFIPYNYKRSDPKTVALLRANADRFSIAVHGCDHTGAEFGSLDEPWLEGAASCALQRMGEHQNRTGMPFDNVIVFPQGWFSTKAIRALKKCGYSAAVNSEAWPVDSTEKPLRICDLLDVAITRYESFPIFLRRYPIDIFDYAFDALFQKPIFGVEHHGYFRDGYGEFVSIVEKISDLRPEPIWMPLGNAVESSCLIRKMGDGQYTLRHFASTLRFKNTSRDKMVLNVEKIEPNAQVEAVLAGGHKTGFETCSEAIRYSVCLEAGEELHAVIAYRKSPTNKRNVSLKYRVKSSVRRILSEVRDNHIARNKWVLSLAQGAKDMLPNRKASGAKTR